VGPVDPETGDDQHYSREPGRARMTKDADASSKGGGKMELAITLGIGGWLVLFAGALLFGVIAQFVGETRTGYEWLVDGIAAALGALIASEFIIATRTYEPVWDGLRWSRPSSAALLLASSSSWLPGT
jgi:hypothetical protein